MRGLPRKIQYKHIATVLVTMIPSQLLALLHPCKGVGLGPTSMGGRIANPAISLAHPLPYGALTSTADCARVHGRVGRVISGVI